MIQMLRKESCSGAIEDLPHAKTEVCLSDCLTKHTAKPDVLLKAVNTGTLPGVDTHAPFRTTLKHKAFAVSFLVGALGFRPLEVPHCTLLGYIVDSLPGHVPEQYEFQAEEHVSASLKRTPLPVYYPTM